MNKNPMNALSIEEVFEHETFKRIRTLTELSGNGGEPQISEEEKAVIRAQYPDDDVAAFNAIWAAREEKQRKEK